MARKEDDKSTIVLNFDEIKDELNKESDDLDHTSQIIEFNVNKFKQELANDNKAEIILFDYNSQYFTKNHHSFPEVYKYNVITDVKELNKKLLNKEDKTTVVFNYNAAPKAVNQLLAQINSKFSHTKTIIIAKNLSQSAAQKHKSTKSAASSYISAPFKTQLLVEEISKLHS